MSFFKHVIIILLGILPAFLFSQKTETNRWIIEIPPALQYEPIVRQFSDRGMKCSREIKYTGFELEIWESPKTSRSVQDELAELRARFPDIYIEPDHTYELTLIENDSIVPNDPQFAHQYYLHNTSTNYCTSETDVNALTAWNTTTGDRNVVIAVIDGGMDLDHPDLKDNLWINSQEVPGDGIDNDNNGYIDDVHGYDFANEDGHPEDDTDSGHGTHVAGIIGARGNDSTGIAGICWNCKLMPLKFTDSTGLGTTSAAIQAIEYVIKMKKRGVNIVVINNSWGGGSFSPLLKQSILRANAEGITFVAAAGNDSRNNDRLPFYPASYQLPNVISVGAMDCRDSLAEFSNYGLRSVDIVAMGEAILSTVPPEVDQDGTRDGYGYRSGTSMAAPQVSGAVALLASLNPIYTPQQMLDMLLFSGSPLEKLERTSQSGKYLNIGNLLTINYANLWNNYSTFVDINCLLVDGDMLWMGTQNGLALIDGGGGVRRVYNTSNSALLTNWIETLHKDNAGRIWIGDSEGVLAYYEPDVDSISVVDTAITSQIAGQAIRDIDIDTSGNLWIATYGGGLVQFAPDSNDFTLYNMIDFGLLNDIIAISIDEQQNIWIGIDGAGVAHFDPDIGGLKAYTVVDGLPSLTITAISIDAQKNVWVGTNIGLVQYNRMGDNFGPILLSEGIAAIHSIENKVWVGTLEGLVSYNILNSGDSTHLSIPNPHIRAIGGETNASVWIASYEGDHALILSNHNGNDWQIYNYANNQIPDYFITGIDFGKDSTAWIGSGSLSHFDGRNWRVYNATTLGFPTDQEGKISAIGIDTLENELWAGIEGHSVNYLIRIRLEDNSVLEVYKPDSLSILSSAVSVIQIHKDTIWVGTKGAGVAFLKDNNWQTYEAPALALENNHITAIDIQQNGTIWIGTEEGGLTRFRPGQDSITFRRANSALPNDQIKAIKSHPDGSVWVSTEGGIVHITDNLRQFTALHEDFYNGNATAIDIHPDSSIWFGTDGEGIFRYDPTDSSWLRFHRGNSQIETDYIQKLKIHPDGAIWLGSWDGTGLTIFSPTSHASFATERQTICLNDALSFTNTGPTGDSLEWRVAGNIVDGDSSQLTHVFRSTGTFKVELTVYADIDTSSFFTYIAVRKPDTVNLGNDTSSHARAVLLGLDLPTMGSYAWANANAEEDILSTEPLFSVRDSGEYILKATDLCGIASADTIKVRLTGGDRYVLPGDVDGDGRVNAIDLLLMGIAHTDSTHPDSIRLDTNTDFTPKEGKYWNETYERGIAAGVDKMHGDADGDGEINIFIDGEVVRTNANTPHPAFHSDRANISLSLEILNEEQVELNDTISFEFLLREKDSLNGDSSMINSIYGLAVGVGLNVGLHTDPILERNASTWLGLPADSLYENFIHKPASQHIDFVFSRLPQPPDSGIVARKSGSFGRGGVITIISDIDTTRIRESHIPLTLTLSNVAAIDENGDTIFIKPSFQQRTQTIMMRMPEAFAKVVNFQCFCDGDSQKFSWKAWEKNIKRFELWKSDTVFRKIDFINSKNIQNDTVIDTLYSLMAESDNTASYRLFAFDDKDQKIDSSAWILGKNCIFTDVNSKLPKSTIIHGDFYPNPAQNTLHIDLQLLQPADIRLELYNLSGQKMLIHKAHIQSGKQVLSENVAHMPSGLYVVRLMKDGMPIKVGKIWVRQSG